MHYMLTFFRKIRKSLIENSSTRKPASPTGRYILYAIGEIALVVIGIIIALQVNEWNNRRNLRSLEITTLRDIKASLETDIIHINRSIEEADKNRASMDIILDHLATDQPYADSLKYHFGNICGTWAFTINRSVFESLNSEGLALISNKELRLELVKLYDVQATGQKERKQQMLRVESGGPCAVDPSKNLGKVHQQKREEATSSLPFSSE